MTITPLSASLQTFLKYDFEKDAKEGLYLVLESEPRAYMVIDKQIGNSYLKEGEAKPRLKIVNWNELSSAEKAYYVMTRGATLRTVAEYAYSHFRNLNLNPKDLNKLRLQCAHLRKKVRVYNEGALFPIAFHNLYKGELVIHIERPLMPVIDSKALRKEQMLKCEVKVSFSALSTFEKIAKKLHQSIPYLHCLKGDESSDRMMIKKNAANQVKIIDWVSENGRKELTIKFSKIKLQQYGEYIRRVFYNLGYEKGYKKSHATDRYQFLLRSGNGP